MNAENRTEPAWVYVNKTYRHSPKVDLIGLYVEDGIVTKVSINDRRGTLQYYSKALSRFIGAGPRYLTTLVQGGELAEEYRVKEVA